MTPSGDLPSNSTNVTPRGGRISATPSRFTGADGSTPVINRWSQATPGAGGQTPTRFGGFSSNFSSAKPDMMPATQ